MRSGAQALSLLAVPLNVHLLQALEEEPRSLIDLRRAVGSPPQTTMRSHLHNLAGLGLVERERASGVPGIVNYALREPGRELLTVAAILRDWLAQSPEQDLSLGDMATKSAVKALADGWSSSIIRALAARPQSLTELDGLISGLSYPSLERRLMAMRLAGQLEARPGKTRATPYAATTWLRESIGPLAAAARWECRYMADSADPVARHDVEAMFFLAVPLMSIPSTASGACRFTVEVQNGNGAPSPAGVLVAVEDGRVTSCVARLQGGVDAWAAGASSAWVEATFEQEFDRLELGGDRGLAVALLDGLHGALFATRQRA